MAPVSKTNTSYCEAKVPKQVPAKHVYLIDRLAVEIAVENSVVTTVCGFSYFTLCTLQVPIPAGGRQHRSLSTRRRRLT